MSESILPGVTKIGENIIKIEGAKGAHYVYKGQIWVKEDLSYWRKVSKITDKDGVWRISWTDSDKKKRSAPIDDFFLWVLKEKTSPVMNLVIDGHD